MEWVETTAETIELAKNLALDQLGVAEDDAEFEVVEEPKQGLFGRTRGEARVRARVRPNSVRIKNDRRDKSAKRGPRKEGDAKGPRREKSTTPRPKRGCPTDSTSRHATGRSSHRECCSNHIS